MEKSEKIRISSAFIEYERDISFEVKDNILSIIGEKNNLLEKKNSDGNFIGNINMSIV